LFNNSVDISGKKQGEHIYGTLINILTTYQTYKGVGFCLKKTLFQLQYRHVWRMLIKVCLMLKQ